MAEKKKRKYNISEEERERRRQRAKEQVEKGVIGGARKGSGRPKADRAQTQVADRIKEDADKIYNALIKALKSDSPTVALKAALAMLDIESKESELQIKEEQRRFDSMTRDELMKYIVTKMEQLAAQGVNITDIITGQAREVLPVPNLEAENG